MYNNNYDTHVIIIKSSLFGEGRGPGWSGKHKCVVSKRAHSEPKVVNHVDGPSESRENVLNDKG